MNLKKLYLTTQGIFILHFVFLTMYGCTGKYTIVQPVAQMFNTESRALWEDLNPSFATIFQFIDTTDLVTIEPGTYMLDDNAWVIIMECDMKTSEKALLEVHDGYIDVQMPISTTESYGYKARNECKIPKAPMDTEKDIQFFSDSINEFIELQPGQFIVFDTSHAHAPTIGSGPIKKLVGKIKK